MAHRALTLKYRPQVFSDLVGQDHVSHVLERSIETGRVAHAYLFTGARGVGKTTSARILAKALNCPNRGAAGRPADPCNRCTSCDEITQGISLDVAEIDGASNRGIADVQALREKVRFAPTGGRHRIVIIDEVHQLSNDAFAALLKTLEEPPPHLVFIFATTDPQKLPDTIRSRTQRYDFARVPARKVATRLGEIQTREAEDPEGVRFTLTDAAALLIAHHGEGSMRDSIGALDQVVSAGQPEIDEALVRQVLGIPDHEAYFRIVDAVVQRDAKAALRALNEAFEKGMDPREVAEGLTEHVRHVLVLRVDPTDGAELVAASDEDLQRLRAQGEGWSEDDLLRLLRITSDVMWPMRDSPQPLVHLEAAVLQMATLERGETLAEVLDRLEALERRLGGPGGAPPAGAGPAGATRPAAGTRSARPAGAGAGPAAAAGEPGPAPAPGPAVPPPAPTGRAGPSLAGVPKVGERPGPASGQTPRATASTTADTSRAAPRATPPVAGAAPRATTAAQAAPAATAAATPAPPTAPRAARTPAPPPAAAPSPMAPGVAATVLEAEPAAVEELWRQVLARVNQRKRLLGAFLEEGFLLGRSEGSIVLAMGDLHRSVVQEKENQGILAEEVVRAFGPGTQVRCEPLAAAGEAARTPTPEETKQMVAKTLEWFGGEAVPPRRRNERTE
jgi:DNA polymerase-3 subunit gamma/tau